MDSESYNYGSNSFQNMETLETVTINSSGITYINDSKKFISWETLSSINSRLNVSVINANDANFSRLNVSRANISELNVSSGTFSFLKADTVSFSVFNIPTANIILLNNMAN